MSRFNHALQTMRLIDDALKADQGASYRGWLAKVLPHIGDAYRTDEDGFRSHLGASQLGQECARQIWYGFRWATKPRHSGRILRLFNRGHLEEGRIIALLLMIGVQVYQQDAEGKQYRISWAEGHAGGSGDGVAINIPDLPKGTACLLEFKTHSQESFVSLAGKLPDYRKYLEGKGIFGGKGVRESKFEHYVQMQLYMHKMGLSVALYVAVCKNTDDMYMELITYDREIAEQFLERGEKIVWHERAPSRINGASAGFFLCRFCDHRAVCHLKAEPEVNCRTCQFSKPVANAAWICNKHNMELTKEKQLVGCVDWFASEDL